MVAICKTDYKSGPIAVFKWKNTCNDSWTVSKRFWSVNIIRSNTIQRCNTLRNCAHDFSKSSEIIETIIENEDPSRTENVDQSVEIIRLTPPEEPS